MSRTLPSMAMPYPTLSVIVPVYNAERTIRPLVAHIIDALSPNFDELQVVLVNDGSKDRTDAEIRELLSGPYAGFIKYVNLARNFGEHNAVLCGLRHADMGAAAIIDDDFQNPPEEILRLMDKLSEGFDVVYSYYDKKQHSLFRNLGSRFNDWVATRLLRKPRGLYLSSFKVINRFVIDMVTSYNGPYPYLDGLILRSTDAIGTQKCVHDPREAGSSNYTLGRLVALWLNMSTSFSFSPLRIATYLGLSMAGIGCLLVVFFTVSWSIGGVITEGVPKGWASTIISLTIFSGVQLVILGLLGEYVGRIFMTQNKQPQSVVREVIKGKGQGDGPE